MTATRDFLESTSNEFNQAVIRAKEAVTDQKSLRIATRCRQVLEDAWTKYNTAYAQYAAKLKDPASKAEAQAIWLGEMRSYEAEVSESRFFILETRMRVSLIQSRSSRRDREFLTLTLRLRDETEKKIPPISGIETRSRFTIFTLRLRDENENSVDLISFFETRPRILKLAIFP